MKVLISYLSILAVLVPGSMAWADVAADQSRNDQVAPAPRDASAQKQQIKYVDDKLVVLMRTGQSNKHKIIQAVSSGTALEVLETAEKYSRVRSANGTEGWVLNQYLSDEPIAEQRLMESQKVIALLEAKVEQKTNELHDANKNHNDLRKRFESMELKLHRLEAENTDVRTLAAKPLKLANDNKSLLEERDSLKSELKQAQSELSELRDDSENRWFLTGGGVVFMSLLIGMMVPKFTPKQKSGW